MNISFNISNNVVTRNHFGELELSEMANIRNMVEVKK